MVKFWLKSGPRAAAPPRRHHPPFAQRRERTDRRQLVPSRSRDARPARRAGAGADGVPLVGNVRHGSLADFPPVHRYVRKSAIGDIVWAHSVRRRERHGAAPGDAKKRSLAEVCWAGASSMPRDNTLRKGGENVRHDCKSHHSDYRRDHWRKRHLWLRPRVASIERECQIETPEWVISGHFESRPGMSAWEMSALGH